MVAIAALFFAYSLPTHSSISAVVSRSHPAGHALSAAPIASALRSGKPKKKKPGTRAT